MSKFEQYNHHNPEVKVWVRSELKGKHRDHCLCYSCDAFKPEDRANNCEIAQGLYEVCVETDMVIPVWECPIFREK